MPLLVWPVAGGDGAQTKLPNNEFTVVAAWWLPFDAPGLNGTPGSTDAEKIVDAGLKSVQGLYRVLREVAGEGEIRSGVRRGSAARDRRGSRR